MATMAYDKEVLGMGNEVSHTGMNGRPCGNAHTQVHTLAPLYYTKYFEVYGIVQQAGG